MSKEEVVAVIAGNHAEFRYWFQSRADFREGMTKYVYVCSPQTCLGRHFDRIIFVGTYAERSDFTELREYALMALREPPE